MSEIVKLVSKSDEASNEVRAKISALLERVTDEEYTALAAVLIRHDGAVFVTTCSNGNRVMLLGAISDLQYTVAKDGDA